MTNKQERMIYALMAINAIIFAVIFISVSCNYRLASDDLHYLMKTKELGVWESMLFYYNNWNPRWSATLVTNLFLSQGGSSQSLVLFHLSTYFLGFISVLSMLSALCSGLLLQFTKSQLTILSGYVLAGLFYCSFAQDDTWFWLTVVPMYLWACFIAVFSGSLLLRTWNPPLRYGIVALGFLYAGGASESAALASLITLFYLGFITHKKYTQVPIDRKALHIATISCFIGFAICLSGKGIHIRHDHLPQVALSDKILVGFWNYFRFNFIKIPLLLPMLILIVAPFGFFGRKQLMYQLISIKEVFWTNRKLWAWADMIIASLAFALAFVMSEMGPTRTWIPITFVLLTVGICIAYILGTWAYITCRGKLFQVVIAAQIILIGFQLMMGYNQIQTTNAYAQSVDKRMLAIPQILDESNDPIKLSPLTDSGWLLSAEISEDTTHHTNRHLKLYFGSSHGFVVNTQKMAVSE